MASGKDAATLGYYTVMESERTGWTGGLLVINAAGRPLEFQCTLPIRPTRAHEILFGSSLREHLISEVIGPTLLQKCRTPITLLLCQQIEALTLQEIAGETGAPRIVGLVDDPAEPSRSTLSLGGHQPVDFGKVSLWVAMEHLADAEAAVERLQDLPDVTEPFERITEAIREAQTQIARAA